MEPKRKIDETRLTPDQKDKLDKWKRDVKQLQTLEDIATMAQEMLGIMDDQKKEASGGYGRKTLIIDHVTGDDFVKILNNMQESLQEFKARKDPEIPDYASPVVKAVGQLETALKSSLKPAEAKAPIVNVPAPEVTVNPADVDLTKVEKILKTDLPKAFKESIKLIPKVDVQKTDFKPLLDSWEGISEQLQSIDNAVRMKPQPGSMQVTNADGTAIFATPTALFHNQITVTTAGSERPLGDTIPNTTLKAITIKALSTNTGLVYIGGAGVTSANGFQLSAGESVSMDIDSPSRVYIDVATNGEGVTWLGIV